MTPPPRTLPEWGAYLDALPPEVLWSKALDANNAFFVRGLLEDGYSAQEVEDLFTLLAHRLVETGQALPLEGWFDLTALSARAKPST